MSKYQHGEAFCLMWYLCDDCGHKERIWNSRDGVTPFSLRCPSCGEFKLQHWQWQLDEPAKDHDLVPGQRFFRDGTKDEAVASLRRRFKIFEERGQPAPDDIKAKMLANLDKPSEQRAEFQDGWPALDICAFH